jgi:hypothetical protein
MTLETVAGDTPASCATSRMVMVLERRGLLELKEFFLKNRTTLSGN